ncbi:MAG: hypothetical protein QOE90_2326 [Thermoplasmata archaeon]|jgi:hypothetical protein|nr:hypothetical protein [Thermoplasmata archaeon]
MRRLRDDAAASDLVANVLMVAIAVGLGAILAGVVAANLNHVPPTPTSVSFAPVHAGDGSLRLLLHEGDAIPVSQLRVAIGRNGSAALPVPATGWTAGGPTLAPGGALVVNLTPSVAPGESIRVLLARADQNLLVLDATSAAATGASALPATGLAPWLSVASLPPDGATSAALAVRVTNAAGAGAVSAVQADVSALAGTPASLALRDDGKGPDAEGGDGNWTGSIVVAPGVAPGVYAVNLTAYDAAGAASGAGRVNLTVAVDGTLTVGKRLDVPASNTIHQLRLRNWSYDTAHLSRIQNDALVLRILGQGNQQWSVYVQLTLCTGNVPCVSQVETYGPANDTIYAPRNATLPLAGLDLDLLNPVGSLQLVRASGAADPSALYPASGVLADPTLVVAFLGDETTNGNANPGQSQGLLAAEVLAT